MAHGTDHSKVCCVCGKSFHELGGATICLPCREKAEEDAKPKVETPKWSTTKKK